MDELDKILDKFFDSNGDFEFELHSLDPFTNEGYEENLLDKLYDYEDYFNSKLFYIVEL